MLLNDLPTRPLLLPKVNYDQPPSPASWNGMVLVGEAPGKDEVRLGHPFVGRSGQLLNDVLKESGIERSQCVVANVFRYQPPGNKVDHFFISKRAAKTQRLSIAEDLGRFGSAWCLEQYREEINALAAVLHTWKPAVIVALGRTPLWALTGQNGLLNLVGCFLDCRLTPEARVLPTFHPSYILRGNWDKRSEWKRHFITAFQQVKKVHRKPI